MSAFPNFLFFQKTYKLTEFPIADMIPKSKEVPPMGGTSGSPIGHLLNVLVLE